jgi:hypothetical protein
MVSRAIRIAAIGRIDLLAIEFACSNSTAGAN